jgi:myosin heavy subunit
MMIDGVDDAKKFHRLRVYCLKIHLLNNNFNYLYGLLRSHVMIFQLLAYVFFFFQKALDVVQMCKEDQERVFNMLGAILRLGNIYFEVKDDENHHRDNFI